MMPLPRTKKKKKIQWEEGKLFIFKNDIRCLLLLMKIFKLRSKYIQQQQEGKFWQRVGKFCYSRVTK